MEESFVNIDGEIKALNIICPPMHNLWVVEGTVDFPVQIYLKPENQTMAIHLSDDHKDPEGFFEIRPVDITKASSPAFWLISQPIKYLCRGLVRAPEASQALMRGRELFEDLADRLTLLGGCPVRVLDINLMYNEDSLRICIAGQQNEYEAVVPGGEELIVTQPLMNSHFPSLLRPTEVSLEAIRWFRRGLMADRKLDQFLFYYISLESILKHIPGVSRDQKRDKSGNIIPKELESHEVAAIKHLIKLRFPEKSLEFRQELASIRGAIAHGKVSREKLSKAVIHLRDIQRLAADGIATVSGLDPTQFHVLEPNPFESIDFFGITDYSPTDNPAKEWGGLLSDGFKSHCGITQSR